MKNKIAKVKLGIIVVLIIIILLTSVTLYNKYKENLITQSVTESVIEIMIENEEVKNLIGPNFNHIKDPYMSKPSKTSNGYYWHSMFIENSDTQFIVSTVLYDDNKILWIEIDPLYNGYENKKPIRLEVENNKR